MSIGHRLVCVIAIAVISSGVQSQVTWYVDDDNCPGPGDGTPGDPFCMVQHAINHAHDGDEVVVAPGTYFESINYLGKEIAVRSSDGAYEVGVTDFLALLAAWGPNPGHPADLDGDGAVGVTDFLILLANWGPCP